MERQVAQWLCVEGILTPQQLERALEVQAESSPIPPLGVVLRSLKMVTEDHYAKALARHLGLDLWDPEELPPDPEVRKLIPPAMAQEFRIIPRALENGWLHCVSSGPVAPGARAKLEFLASRPLRFSIGTETDISKMLQSLYGLSVESMIANMAGGEGDNGDDQEVHIHDLREMAHEPTLINLVNLIISNAINEKASDIHVEPFENELKIKYRVDGVLQEMPPPPKQFQSAIVSRIKIMAGLDIAERYIPQDGHIRVNLPTARVDIRVSTVPVVHGESVVMRLLNKDQGMMELTDLGMPLETHKRFSALLAAPYGIILVTGPTGSGKSTTLYSALNQIYTPTKKIITIEDPVEYQMQGVNQIPVRPKRGLTFASGLRAILRQDPDIVMVGEIRDRETADISIRAALTGHLVFSTLHTNDAPSAVTRLIDMGVEPFLIASSTQGFLAQRLVRRLCPVCRIPEKADPGLREQFAVETLPEVVYTAAGCEECRNRGYKGRLGVFELLTMTEELHNLILRNASAGELKRAARNSMDTMRQDGWAKICVGQTTVAEVIQVTHFDNAE